MESHFEKPRDIETKLFEIIAQASFLKISTDAIRLSDLLADIGIDSLAFMQVIVSIEEDFGITILDEDLALEKFETVESIKNHILFRSSNSDNKKDG